MFNGSHNKVNKHPRQAHENDNQENVDPNQGLFRNSSSSGYTSKFNCLKSSGSRTDDPWSAHTCEQSTGNEEVEISCFNLGPSKQSSLSQLQQVVSLHQLETLQNAGNISDALIYLEEFEDIDWVKHSQILQLIEMISKQPKDEVVQFFFFKKYSKLKQQVIYITQIISQKFYLLTKQIIKMLFQASFKLGPLEGQYASNEIDKLLETQILNFAQEQFQNYQQQFLPIIFYTHAHQLQQWQQIENCWQLLMNKIQFLNVPEHIREDWDKTVQKVSEFLIRSLIESCQTKDSRTKYLEIISQILQNALKSLNNKPNDIFFNKLIDYAFKNKQVVIAETLFQFMTNQLNINPTIVTINTLIDQYFKNQMPNNAWSIFDALKTKYTTIKPDNFTYTTLINGLKSSKDGLNLVKAFSLFDEYKQTSNPDQIIYNCLMDACINAGDLQRAYQLLEEMKNNSNIQLDEITYNTLIKGCGRKKRLQDALSLFEEMKTMGIVPNRISFNSLLDSCVKCNKMNIAWKYYDEMTRKYNIVPDNFTYSILVNGIKTNHSNREELLKAIQLLEQIQETGQFKADEILYNSLIDACVKFNEIPKSLSLFEEMKRKQIEPSSVTYGILIKAYGKVNSLNEAFAIFEEMKKKQVQINDVTYGCLVDACVKNDRLDQALTLIEQMKFQKIALNTVVYTTLIKGFAKACQIDEAMAVFKVMKTNSRTYPNLITYNSLLDGLVKCNHLEEADQLFQEMLENQLKPDLITFSTLLKGYCKKGNMRKVNEIVSVMIQQKITPDESLLLLIAESCLNQQHYALGVQILDQFCQHPPQQSQLLISSLKLYSLANQLENSLSVYDRFLQLLDEGKLGQVQRQTLEQTVNQVVNGSGSSESLLERSSRLVVIAATKYDIKVKDIDGLLCVENQDNLEKLINCTSFSNKLKELAEHQGIKPSVEIMLRAHIKKNSYNKDPINEQLGKIFQNCAKEGRDAGSEYGNILRNNNSNQNNDDNENQIMKNNSFRQKQRKEDEGNKENFYVQQQQQTFTQRLYNNSNNVKKPKQQNQYKKRDYEFEDYENDLCDYLPKQNNDRRQQTRKYK